MTFVHVNVHTPGSFYAPAGPRQQQQRRRTTAVDPGEEEETGAALLPIADGAEEEGGEEGGEGDAAFLGRVKAARPKTSLALGGCVVFLAGGERCEAVSRVSNGKKESREVCISSDSHIYLHYAHPNASHNTQTARLRRPRPAPAPRRGDRRAAHRLLRDPRGGGARLLPRRPVGVLCGRALVVCLVGGWAIRCNRPSCNAYR